MWWGEGGADQESGLRRAGGCSLEIRWGSPSTLPAPCATVDVHRVLTRVHAIAAGPLTIPYCCFCSRRMSEELFWIIYFTLVRSLMPPEAFNPAAAPPPPTPPAAAPAAGPKPSASTNTSAKRVPATAATSTPAAAAPAAASAPSPARIATPTAAAGPASAAATTPRGPRGRVGSAGGGHPSPITGDEAELLELGATSSLGDEDGEEQEQEHAGEGAAGRGARGRAGAGGGHGGDSEDEDVEGEDDGLGDLDALEDDPELAAYLQVGRGTKPGSLPVNSPA